MSDQPRPIMVAIASRMELCQLLGTRLASSSALSSSSVRPVLVSKPNGPDCCREADQRVRPGRRARSPDMQRHQFSDIAALDFFGRRVVDRPRQSHQSAGVFNGVAAEQFAQRTVYSAQRVRIRVGFKLKV